MRKYVLVVAAAGLLAARGAAADEPGQPAAPPVKVTAQKLAEDYDANEAFADEQYTDKAVEVSGKVLRVLKSKYRSPRKGSDYVVELDREAPGAETPLMFIFAWKDRAQLFDLRPNDLVTLRGKCQGRVTWSRSPGLAARDPSEIWFQECQLVPPPK